MIQNGGSTTNLEPHFEVDPGPFVWTTPLLVEGAPVESEAMPATTPAACVEKSTSEREPARGNHCIMFLIRQGTFL